MAWQMVDDLTGDVVPEGQDHRLSLHLDTSERLDAAGNDTEVRGWDVASTDPRELLAQLGEHLSGQAAPLAPSIEQTQQRVREAQEKIDALRIRVVVPEPIDTSGQDSSDMALGRRIHEGLRALDLPYRVEIALRRFGYRLALAYEGAAVGDDACPHDPDGLHFPTCGCDGVDPLNPNASPAVDESAGDAPSVVHADESTQVSEPQQADEVGESAGNDIPPKVATPAAAPVDQVGEAESGRATDATIRIWAQAWNVPCSTTGGLKKWVRESYERVRGGQPDAATWAHAGIPAPQTSSPARPGDETPPPSDPFPPAGRTAADPSPTADESSTSDAVEGDPPPAPDSAPVRAAGHATETPEPAGSGAPPAPAPDGEVGAGTGSVTALGDGTTHDQAVARAEELLADKQTPRAVVEATGLSLGEVRAISADMRSRR